ncbi:3-isopropylmalate dehydratase small subunit [Micromonospora siamensis]|uniref:3-isopropylmalate dehydratase small subunit n=1 Tax=Micromonospora siamensis TaxID=299152 RepID=A0A1C5HET8_9ACTN|nr:3-isopropylmalate dehydratase small subunit [Micromonospora siamensis]SCG44515.1 3-isopropylmalate/(R)-2-methylmalate dehydratase small subunit [Micromonospora siamensis]
MNPVRRHTGCGLVLRRSDVDTDQIIPAEFCKRLTKSGYEDALFAHWRKNPGFVFNLPERADATVLVAGHNFGTGSSREHAVWALRDWGIAAVIATSFGDIFLRNALKNQLLAVALPEAAVAVLAERVESDPAYQVTVDVEHRTVLSDAGSWSFSIGTRERRLLLNGQDDIDVTMLNEDTISSYERDRERWLPRLRRGVFAGTTADGTGIFR